MCGFCKNKSVRHRASRKVDVRVEHWQFRDGRVYKWGTWRKVEKVILVGTKSVWVTVRRPAHMG